MFIEFLVSLVKILLGFGEVIVKICNKISLLLHFLPHIVVYVLVIFIKGFQRIQDL